MANYNKVIIIGNLTREPDYKQLSSGQAICRLTIANNRSYKNKQTGATVSEVCFIDVDVWGPQADHCRQYLQKGRPVLIDGRLKQENWTDAEGKARSRHGIVAERVVFLGTANASEHAASEGFAGQEEYAAPKKAASSISGEMSFKDESPFEDDLPF